MSADKVLALDDLLARLDPLRAAGRTIALTNGLFDVLHVGHLRYLEGAASEADVLVEAVNSDASARALKGPGRPGSRKWGSGGAASEVFRRGSAGGAETIFRAAGFMPRIARAMTRISSGVVPQHPPIRLAPAATRSLADAARYSGVIR